VAKHAKATRVRVAVMRAEHEFVLRIDDDGHGFAGGAIHSTRGTGHGLANMEARAALAGGRCEVISTPGAGTSVIVRLPLAFDLRRPD
jgi:NarL family two-component system sensor histidine kinase LiaS